MPPTRSAIPQPIIDLYDEYTHAPLDRRAFLERLAALAGGSAAAYALLPVLENNYAVAQIVAPDDGRLTTEDASVPAPGGGTVAAYVAKPADAAGPLPAVVVIHENRGLNPHIHDVARRMALEGYVAVAPDLLSSAGGTPADEDKAREMIGQLDAEKTLAEALAVVDYARRGRDDVTGRVGTVGFCWGGALVNRIAAADPQVNATVSYYGRQPSAEEAKKISAPLMLHYASLDERINAGIPQFTATLVEAGIPYTLHVYEGANHAFNNDTNAARYDEQAATLAWQRTTDFFARHLKG